MAKRGKQYGQQQIFEIANLVIFHNKTIFVQQIDGLLRSETMMTFHRQSPELHSRETVWRMRGKQYGQQQIFEKLQTLSYFATKQFVQQIDGLLRSETMMTFHRQSPELHSRATAWRMRGKQYGQQQIFEIANLVIFQQNHIRATDRRPPLIRNDDDISSPVQQSSDYAISRHDVEWIGLN